MEEEYYGFAVGLMVKYQIMSQTRVMGFSEKNKKSEQLETLRRHTEKHDMFTKDRINGYHGH